MRGIEQRRYLTEKYQRKQVRLAYTHSYTKPYDRERYIRTEFSRKRRFYDILRGNYVYLDRPWQFEGMIGGNPGEYDKAQMGRMRNHSWRDCGRTGCPSCSNPRRGNGWYGKAEDLLTMPERKALLHLKEELKYYKEERNERSKNDIAR